MVENVLRMDTAAQAQISVELSVEPLALCPSDMLPYNRPRLAWVSQPVVASKGVWLEPQDGFDRVHMSGDGLHMNNGCIHACMHAYIHCIHTLSYID